MRRQARAGVVMLLAATAGCQATQGFDRTRFAPSGDLDTRHRGDDDRAGDARGGDQGPSLGAEVCDGFDNDGDGTIDDNLAATPCTTASGATGSMACVQGVPICRQCEPGETNENECACGLSRTDVCSDTGIWMIGACGDCPPEESTGCGAANACTPNAIEYRRCDLCEEGQPCGTRCVGSKWQCTVGCEWVQVEACKQREAACDRDITEWQPCPRCGFRKKVCDGCFWTFEPCRGQGVCEPGQTRHEGCEQESCASGFASSLNCSDQCQWEPEPVCDGCVPGFNETDEQCVAGYAGCGIRRTRFECQLQSETLCDGSVIGVGRPLNPQIIRNDCINNECTPGATSGSACTTGDGRCGTQGQGCTDSCRWGPPSGECVANPGSCVPGSTRPGAACSTGCPAAVTETCNADGCGYSSNAGSVCGSCTPGATFSAGCGGCGTQAYECSGACQWAAVGTCQENYICTPGDTRTNPSDCGACGVQQQVTETCNGCGWSVTSVTGTCPECASGDTDSESCGACGSRSRTCSGSCSWGGWSDCSDRQLCPIGDTRTTECACADDIVSTCDGCSYTGGGGSCPATACTPGDSGTDPDGCAGTCPQNPSRSWSCDGNCNVVWSNCPVCG